MIRGRLSANGVVSKRRVLVKPRRLPEVETDKLEAKWEAVSECVAEEWTDKTP